MAKGDKEALLIWVLVIVLLVLVISIPYLIAISDLPYWVKFWLLK